MAVIRDAGPSDWPEGLPRRHQFADLHQIIAREIDGVRIHRDKETCLRLGAVSRGISGPGKDEGHLDLHRPPALVALGEGGGRRGLGISAGRAGRRDPASREHEKDHAEYRHAYDHRQDPRPYHRPLRSHLSGHLEDPTHRGVLLPAAADVAVEDVGSCAEITQRRRLARTRWDLHIYPERLDAELVPAASVSMEARIRIDEREREVLTRPRLALVLLKSGHAHRDFAPGR